MQEFAPDATTTPAGSVHQHRCGIKKSSLKINFFFRKPNIFFGPQSLLQSFVVTPKY